MFFDYTLAGLTQVLHGVLLKQILAKALRHVSILAPWIGLVNLAQVGLWGTSGLGDVGWEYQEPGQRFLDMVKATSSSRRSYWPFVGGKSPSLDVPSSPLASSVEARFGCPGCSIPYFWYNRSNFGTWEVAIANTPLLFHVLS